MYSTGTAHWVYSTVCIGIPSYAYIKPVYTYCIMSIYAFSSVLQLLKIKNDVVLTICLEMETKKSYKEWENWRHKFWKIYLMGEV